MNPTGDSDLTPEETKALRELSAPVRADASLEHRIVERLEAEGELRVSSGRTSVAEVGYGATANTVSANPRTARRWFATGPMRPALALAAMVVVFAAGMWTGQRRANSDETAGPAAFARPGYMVLLFEDDSFVPAAPGQEQQRFQEYAAWAGAQRERGYTVDGNELSNDARLLRSAGDSVVVEPGVPSAGLGRVAGYFELEAGGMAEAVDVVRTMPHLAYGGRVALVRIAQR